MAGCLLDISFIIHLQQINRRVCGIIEIPTIEWSSLYLARNIFYNFSSTASLNMVVSERERQVIATKNLTFCFLVISFHFTNALPVANMKIIIYYRHSQIIKMKLN